MGRAGTRHWNGQFMKTRLILAALIASAPLLAGSAHAGNATVVGEMVDDETLVGHVLALADERLALMPAVAAAKWRQHVPVSDPQREAVVVQAAADNAGRAGLATEPVAQFVRLQIGFARDAQQRLFGRWSVQGFDEAEPVRDLTQDLRPRLDRLTAATIEALYLAAPALGRSDFHVLAGRTGAASAACAEMERRPTQRGGRLARGDSIERRSVSGPRAGGGRIADRDSGRLSRRSASPQATP